MLFVKRIFLGFTLGRVCSNLDFLSVSFKAISSSENSESLSRKETESTVISTAADSKNCFQGPSASQG